MLQMLSLDIVPMPAEISPLVLADRLITLAQEADRAGYSASASRLLGTAFAVLDDDKTPSRVHKY